jgi:hypothetical protein
MNLITDESNADLAGLLGTIRIMAPELWGSSERRFILPQRLEDLERPEYLEEIKGKINKVKMLKDMLDAGSITHSEYLSRKAKILLRI